MENPTGITMKDIENSLGEGMSFNNNIGNDEIQKLRDAVAEQKEVEDAAATNVALDGSNLSVPLNNFIRRTPTLHRKYEKIGRNDLCPCGSGKKYKKCCLNAKTYEGFTTGQTQKA